jgi:predicted nucleic acid-binding protein
MALDLPIGSVCFVDANIFAYHFTTREPVGIASTEFLTRVATEEITAAVSLPVLADALHRVMLAAVKSRHGLDATGLVGWIQRHKDCLGELPETAAACEQLEQLPLQVLPVDLPLLHETMRISAECRLLTGDAMIVAVMRRHGLTHLVTNDDDFDRVSDLTVWKPR